jgi:DNA-binding NtrC family response regulator
MRLKILLLGDDPVAMVADAQLLRERNMLVFTAFNLQNINEMIAEVRPDVIFFDAHRSNDQVTNAYNELVNGIYFTNIPVVFTLAEDEVYLVTRKRTEAKDKRSFIADNMTDAVKIALSSSKGYHKITKNRPDNSVGKKNNNSPISSQMRFPFR